MNTENFDNDLSEDDEDYCPDNDKDANSLSENSAPEADDQEQNSGDEESGSKKTKKRKKVTKRKTKRSVESDEDEEEPEKAPAVDPEEEKRRADALWDDFLNGTEIPLNPSSSSTATSSAASKSTTSTRTSIPIIPAPKAPVVKTFEFAGETVEVPIKPSEQEPPSTSTKPLTPGVKRPGTGGGLASVLNQLNKKSKLSVLEKTKMDWDGFKSNEGINEELQTHNRGRDG
jgi:hypothetical protein